MIDTVRVALATATLLTTSSLIAPVQANPDCRANCRSDQIQVTPGDPVAIEVINQTSVPVQVEQVPMIAPARLSPGETLWLDFGWGTKPNISIVFWSETEQPLKAYLFRPEDTSLRIQIRPFAYGPSDRSVDILDDGRVLIY
ncbi:hypothetical protein XM38_047830 [Halomicronema hongdechloris C2206]|uniref:Uncharacterized protein n=1 Tax=Halomicronema hongdechloris C2206 TaxID=1641165 RepID=A0A1Z3HU19_9CYAN|nr:hypothetical protein [Halomicronema hongdechloris]ASC73810.1 hypothetical protein XM38_047830 [Halomicronema hongdechloris C2206]